MQLGCQKNRCILDRWRETVGCNCLGFVMYMCVLVMDWWEVSYMSASLRNVMYGGEAVVEVLGFWPYSHDGELPLWAPSSLLSLTLTLGRKGDLGKRGREGGKDREGSTEHNPLISQGLKS